MSSVAVIGAGAWGTALAIQAARAGNSVTLVGARSGPRRGDRRQPGEPAPARRAPARPDRGVVRIARRGRSRRCWRCPRSTCAACWGASRPGSRHWWSAPRAWSRRRCACRWRSSRELRPGTPAAVLTGPNFAHEIAAGLPAAAVVAAGDAGLREAVAALLGTPSFRLYGNDDPIGAQVGGAAKNVIAIAAGAVIGAGLGENARAALITRGLAELARLAVALGGRAETVMGLSGLGDLLLTCTGAGQPQLQPRAWRSAAARRWPTSWRPAAPSPRAWPRRPPSWRAPHGVDMPICAAVASLLAGRTTLAEAIAALLARRGGTNDPRRPDRRRLDHGEPHPGLRARHADRGDARRRPDRRCVLRRAEAAQPVPPPVRRGRVQRRLRPRLLRHARRRGPPGGAPVRRRDVRRHGVLARRADHRRRGVHAADDGGAGAGLRRDPGEVRARGGRCRASRSPTCC